MGVYKVKWSFFQYRKWVFIRSHNFQNHPQAGDYNLVELVYCKVFESKLKFFQ